jgi:hypothetical protein
MQGGTQLDGFESDASRSRENSFTATEVDIGRGQVVETLVVPPRVVVGADLGQACFDLARRRVVPTENSETAEKSRVL